MRVLMTVLALAACTPAPERPSEAPPATSTESNLAQMPAWDAARAAGVDFRAVGQEPGWMVDVYAQDRIVALIDYGQTLIAFPRSEPAYPQEGATRYDTQADGHTLSLTIRRAPCQDAMSGEAYPAAVELVIDGRTLTGCGRTV